MSMKEFVRDNVCVREYAAVRLCVGEKERETLSIKKDNKLQLTILHFLPVHFASISFLLYSW
jgi:hypothetical protein